ncbi:MAG: RHS repeat-associated core domain-containing protein [Chitinophagaceae bacterium]
MSYELYDIFKKSFKNLLSVNRIVRNYNYANGNLTDRNDKISNTRESFSYDGAERLTSSAAAITPGGSLPAGSHPSINVSYDTRFYGSFGQIISKTDAGNFKYGGAIRNAVTSISDPGSLVSHETQNISYTGFNKVEKITETITSIPYEEDFYYGPDEQRAYSEQKQGGTLSRQRVYFDEFEAQRITGKSLQMLHYIYSSDGNICGVVVADGVSGRFDYYGIYTDHLGSIVAITDETGNVVHRQAFDPWGRERNPDTWDYTASAYKKPDWLFRGYTSHEMFPEYGLINMNGRLYDPLNGRMLRPDNYVQDPGNTQSYNRYSYCWNNPLKYTDPSGDIIYFMPNYSMGNDGKANVGLTVGVGIPNTPLSVNLTVGHDFSSGNTYASAGIGGGGFSANAGWGTKSGFFANVGWGPGGYNGFSTNVTGIGVGVSEHGGMYATIGPFGINSQGIGFGVSFSYSQALVYDYSIDVEEAEKMMTIFIRPGSSLFMVNLLMLLASIILLG